VRVTTTDPQQDMFVGIGAVYEDKQHEVGSLGEYFAALRSAWEACTELAVFSSPEQIFAFRRQRERDHEQRAASQKTLEHGHVRPLPGLIELLARHYYERSSLEEVIEDLEPEMKMARRRRLERPERKELAVFRLRIESPMEITLAVVHGGGVLGVSAYAIHLLRQVLHDPDRVGGWLPRLVESWHRGMAGVEVARQEHEEAELIRRWNHEAIVGPATNLMMATVDLGDIRAVEVETIGAGDPPDDLKEATSDIPDS
jgi:hypothetical protein